ncbi:serine hydrolase [Methylococcus sp. EFPC2]|uniref:serine hydrolase n=1 Tax=Methylococcus sp. EFPC2 TaxID=2812648 RepID=UPI001967D270|nr:serine hydrolase [Methylococcus sp. EFPC2]QSA97486.1 serine hydrolase [Methylococcus sp. EFPC2]
MLYRSIASTTILIWSTTTAVAEETCDYRSTTPVQSANAMVTRGDWLAVEHLRVGLESPRRFMPGTVMRNLAKPSDLVVSSTPIDLDRATAVDPDDGAEKPLRVLLDVRLYADGILVLQGDEVLLEHYRPGFSPSSPRLLLQASRPILTTMLADAAEAGQLSREQSLARALPELAKQANLRKISVQRLLDNRTGLVWSSEDRRLWLAASGWKTAADVPVAHDVGSWLRSRADWPRTTEPPALEIGGPEGELLVRVLEKVSKQPVSHKFCESVLAGIGAEHEAFWASDPAGTALADGLALSLRDFARFGMAMIQARAKKGPSKVVPNWFAESLASAETKREPAPEVLHELGAEFGWKYRFATQGQLHQAAILGPFGNSLLIDFDRKLVIALFASVPKDYSPLALASLRSLWSAIGRHRFDQSPVK